MGAQLCPRSERGARPACAHAGVSARPARTSVAGDRRVRRAVEHGTSRQAILDTIDAEYRDEPDMHFALCAIARSYALPSEQEDKPLSLRPLRVCAEPSADWNDVFAAILGSVIDKITQTDAGADTVSAFADTVRSQLLALSDLDGGSRPVWKRGRSRPCPQQRMQGGRHVKAEHGDLAPGR